MISTHILDTTKGMPAAHVRVRLEIFEQDLWKLVDEKMTNDDGRIVFESSPLSGDYRLTFMIEDYFKAQNTEHFFLNTPILFRVSDTTRKYHVPLLLNPYGHSTYRGS
jgi:5-hydroxyisourate hydrolase